MISITATEARKQLYKLIDDVAHSHEPVQITSMRGKAVLVGEDDWRAVQETLHLVSIPRHAGVHWRGHGNGGRRSRRPA